MFIFDFLRRQRETRLYSDYYLYPRKLALNASISAVEGTGNGTKASLEHADIAPWLKEQKIDSSEVLDATTIMLEALVDHYSRLLPVQGTTYDDLVANAYHDREQYGAYLERLFAAEDAVDNAIIEKFSGSETVRQDLLLKKEEKHYLRNLDADTIFQS